MSQSGASATAEVEGGDSACWLDEVCEVCGSMRREGHRADCAAVSDQ
jgi:hypothetical protein